MGPSTGKAKEKKEPSPELLLGPRITFTVAKITKIKNLLDRQISGVQNSQLITVRANQYFHLEERRLTPGRNVAGGSAQV